MEVLRVNNEVFKNNYPSDQTIMEMIEEVSSQMGEKSVFVGLTCDGKPVEIEDEDEIIHQPIKNFSNLDLFFKSPRDLAFEAIDSCDHYIDVIIEKIQGVTAHFQSSEMDLANNAFGELIDVLDLFVQLVASANNHILKNLPQEHELKEAVQKQEIHLLSVLKAALPAKENNDTIMLCDLLEYELIDNLTRWKITVIPQIKKLRNL